MTEEEKKEYNRHCYEFEKEGLIEYLQRENIDKKEFSKYIINTLTAWGYEQELKEDGYI